MNVVLVSPEIPQNTGNIGRLTAATGCHLHLIEPLGFSLDDKQVRRAGLDYWPEVRLTVHKTWEEFLVLQKVEKERLWFYSTHASRIYTEAEYSESDYFVFGSETSGFKKEFHELYEERRLRIPIDNKNVRSLNLANAVSVVVYEARRQVSLRGATAKF